jgi:hypothetical protein
VSSIMGNSTNFVGQLLRPYQRTSDTPITPVTMAPATNFFFQKVVP